VQTVAEAPAPARDRRVRTRDRDRDRVTETRERHDSLADDLGFGDDEDEDVIGGIGTGHR
jgi:hypothetical protein